jgi:hypothetical protein
MRQEFHLKIFPVPALKPIEILPKKMKKIAKNKET